MADEIVVTANGVSIIGYTDLAGPAAGAGLAALRHQPGQPAEAADPGEGRRARPRLRRRRAAVDDRRPRRGEDLAAAAGAGVGRAGAGRGGAPAEPSRRRSRRRPSTEVRRGRDRRGRCCS